MKMSSLVVTLLMSVIITVLSAGYNPWYLLAFWAIPIRLIYDFFSHRAEFEYDLDDEEKKVEKTETWPHCNECHVEARKLLFQNLIVIYEKLPEYEQKQMPQDMIIAMDICDFPNLNSLLRWYPIVQKISDDYFRTSPEYAERMYVPQSLTGK